MAANTIIQPDMAARDKAVETGPATVAGGLADIFAALLSGLLHIDGDQNAAPWAAAIPPVNPAVPANVTGQTADPTALPQCPADLPDHPLANADQPAVPDGGIETIADPHARSSVTAADKPASDAARDQIRSESDPANAGSTPIVLPVDNSQPAAVLAAISLAPQALPGPTAEPISRPTSHTTESDQAVVSASKARGQSGRKVAADHQAIPGSPPEGRFDHPGRAVSEGNVISTQVNDGKFEMPAIESGLQPEPTAPVIATGGLRTPAPEAAPLRSAGQGDGSINAVSNFVSPRDQVASALVAFARNSDGVRSVTVRLQPPELGQVLIRVDRTIEGAAHVDLIADKPTTMQLLQRDEPRLQQVLDQAGISGTGRTVSFQTTVLDQYVTSSSRMDNPATGSGGSGQNQGGGAWRDNGDPRQNPSGDADPGHQQARAQWVRMGLDIIA